MKKSVAIVVLFLYAQIGYCDQELIAQKRDGFYRMALTRSWELGVRQLASDDSDESKRGLEQSMVAFAFRYWVLYENKILFREVLFERQIKSSILRKDIDAALLDDPLGRKREGGARFSISEVKISDEEYPVLVGRFKDFIAN